MQWGGFKCNRMKWNELGRNGWHTIERNACNECHGIEWMDWDGLKWNRMESDGMEWIGMDWLAANGNDYE